MPQPNAFLATILTRGGHAFAGFSAARMLEACPAAATGLGSDPLGVWQEWLHGRVEELAAAVSAGKPEVFANYVRSAATLFAARNVPLANVQQALDSLQHVLAHELPEHARPVAESYVSNAITAMAGADAAETEQLAVDTDQGKLAASYLVALLEGDRQQAIAMIHDAAEAGWSVIDLYADVLAPAQREVGRLWLNDDINIAEEHFATATTKMILSQLRGRGQAAPLHGKTVVAAAVPDNHHDVGLQMVANVFEMHGWRTIALGANVPIPDLVQAVDAFQADLLLISAALGKHLPTVYDTIRAVRQHDPTSDIKILVGGTAFSGVADLADQYGADGYAASAMDALQLANRLVGLSI